MGSVDWPLEKLVDYKPESTAQSDFEAFWCRNKGAAQRDVRCGFRQSSHGERV